MPTEVEIKVAVACLSTVYPQFVSKTLADLTDQVASVIQSFTDPLAALADLNISSLVEGVAEASGADTFGNLEEIATGLLTQHVRREATSFAESQSKEFESVTKRVQGIRNLSNQVIQTASQMLSLFPDMPYVAAQKMCESMVRIIDLKVGNLLCLRKHIVQLTNCVLVLVNHAENYREDTLLDITLAAAAIVTAEEELIKSQRIGADQSVVFDTQAFERARQAMLTAIANLTPDQDGDNILAEADFITQGGVGTQQITKSNRSLVTMAIPPLINLINVEIAAVGTQISVINHHVQSLAAVIDEFRKSGNSSRVQTMRSRAIADIKNKTDRLGNALDIVLTRGSTKSLGEEMLFFASRAKTIVAAMDSVKELTLQEGSIEGPDKAFALENAFQDLLTGLLAINVPGTENGIEDSTELSTRVLALTKGAERIMGDLENGTTSENRLATFHLLSLQTATLQVNSIDDSLTVASQQRVLCLEFASIDIKARERYDELLLSMRQLGLDRGVDLLSTGKFDEFLSSDMETLSYLGIGVQCLTDALKGIDDVQTRQQVADIRDEMVARQTNQDVAAADNADQGRSRIVLNVKLQISDLQKNLKTIESISSELTSIAGRLDIDIEVNLGDTPAFLGNLDYLSVGAGGRLSSALEDLSEFPNAGVVRCEPVL